MSEVTFQAEGDLRTHILSRLMELMAQGVTQKQILDGLYDALFKILVIDGYKNPLLFIADYASEENFELAEAIRHLPFK